MSDMVKEVKGLNGTIEVYANYLIIKRKGAMAFLTQGVKGDKQIPFKNLTSIQFKEATSLVNGYIQFGVLGGMESRGGIMDAGKDENTVMFMKKDLGGFVELRQMLEKVISESQTASAQPARSELDELEKLAGLKEKGIISAEEFESKKKQLLGL